MLTIAVCAMVNTVNMVFTTSRAFPPPRFVFDRSTMLLVPPNTLGLIADSVAAMLADRSVVSLVLGYRCRPLVMFPYLGAITEGNW